MSDVNVSRWNEFIWNWEPKGRIGDCDMHTCLALRCTSNYQVVTCNPAALNKQIYSNSSSPYNNHRNCISSFITILYVFSDDFIDRIFRNSLAVLAVKTYLPIPGHDEIYWEAEERKSGWKMAVGPKLDLPFLRSQFRRTGRRRRRGCIRFFVPNIRNILLCSRSRWLLHMLNSGKYS